MHKSNWPSLQGSMLPRLSRGLQLAVDGGINVDHYVCEKSDRKTANYIISIHIYAGFANRKCSNFDNKLSYSFLNDQLKKSIDGFILVSHYELYKLCVLQIFLQIKFSPVQNNWLLIKKKTNISLFFKCVKKMYKLSIIIAMKLLILSINVIPSNYLTMQSNVLIKIIYELLQRDCTWISRHFHAKKVQILDNNCN